MWCGRGGSLSESSVVLGLSMNSLHLALLLTPASCQICCCEVLLDFPQGNGHFEYCRPWPLLSFIGQFSWTFQKNAELSSFSSLFCYWFLFYFFILSFEVSGERADNMSCIHQLKHRDIYTFYIKLPRLFQWVLSLKANNF